MVIGMFSVVEAVGLFETGITGAGAGFEAI